MSELPSGWLRCRLDQIGDVRLGRQRSPERAHGPNMRPYMRAANVGWNGARLDDVKQMDFTANEFETYALRSGDILVGEASGSRDEVGKSLVWQEEVAGACFQNTLIRLRLGEKILPEYIQMHLHYDARRGALAALAKGVGIFHLGAQGLSGWAVGVPPLNEQRRIVDKLETLNAKSRRAKEALEAIPPLLEKFRQSILAAAFRGDLTADWRAKNPDVEPASKLLERIRTERRRRWEEAELEKLRAKGTPPKDDRWKAKYKDPVSPDFRTSHPSLPDGWAWTSVSDLSECLDSIRRPVTRKDRVPGPYPYYGANGRVDFVDSYLFDDELVLVTEDETFYGRTKPIAYRVSGKCWVNNHAHVLRAIPLMDPDFLWLALMHYPVIPWLSGTTGRAKLTQGDLNSLPIALPPVEEAAALVALVKASLSSADALQLKVAKTWPRFEALDSAIMTKAFRGELVPQDPADEPASVLVERIRAERDGQMLTRRQQLGTKRAPKRQAAE